MARWLRYTRVDEAAIRLCGAIVGLPGHHRMYRLITGVAGAVSISVAGGLPKRGSLRNRAATGWPGPSMHCCLLMLFHFVWGLPAMSQNLPTDSPEAVARAVFAALEARQYEAVAPFIDPESLAQFHESALDAARSRERPIRLTVEDLKRYNPEMPDTVAEYQVQQFTRREADTRSWLAGDYAGVETLEQMRALSLEQLFGRWLEAQAPEYRMRQAMRESRNPALEADLLPETLRIRRQVLGEVREGENLAHVVHRFRWEAGSELEPDGEVRVTTLHRTPAGWRMIWSPEFLGTSNWSFGLSETDSQEAGPEIA